MNQSKQREYLRGSRYGIAALGVIALCVFGYLWYWPRITPQEQAPMITLAEDNFSAFQESFHAKSDTTRIVALFSPT